MRELIANLKHAARNRQHATIGGGDFGPADLRHAAKILETHADLLAALDELLRVTVDAMLAEGFTLTDEEQAARYKALAAIAKATAARDASC